MEKKLEYRMICDLDGLVILQLGDWAHKFFRSEVLLCDLLTEWLQYKDVSDWAGCQEDAFDINVITKFTEIVELKDIASVRELIARTIKTPSMDSVSKELFNRI